MHPPLLSAEQVAERIGKSRRQALRIIASGAIESQKLPGRQGAYVVTEAALTRYLTQEAEATP